MAPSVACMSHELMYALVQWYYGCWTIPNPAFCHSSLYSQVSSSPSANLLIVLRVSTFSMSNTSKISTMVI